MSICSVVVFTRPEAMEGVCAEIGKSDICEVVAAESGRIIVVLDTRDRQVMSDAIMALNDIDGVANVSLVYEYFEPGDSIGGKRPDDVSTGETSCAAGEGCGCAG